jgi:hypothetical protein
MPRTPKRIPNFPGLRRLTWVLALALAAPAAAWKAPWGPVGAALSAGIGPQWPLRGDEGGSDLLLGTDLTSGPHLLEVRHLWFWHPGFTYMTSVDRVVTLAYGHTLGVPGLFGCVGLGLHEDYGTPGIQVGVRLNLNRFGLEGYGVVKDYPALTTP